MRSNSLSTACKKSTFSIFTITTPTWHFEVDCSSPRLELLLPFWTTSLLGMESNMVKQVEALFFKSGSMLLCHPTILLDWLVAHPGFKSPFLSYPKSAPCDWDLLTVEATLTHKTHCCVPLTNLPLIFYLWHSVLFCWKCLPEDGCAIIIKWGMYT